MQVVWRNPFLLLILPDFSSFLLRPTQICAFEWGAFAFFTLEYSQEMSWLGRSLLEVEG